MEWIASSAVFFLHSVDYILHTQRCILHGFVILRSEWSLEESGEILKFTLPISLPISTQLESLKLEGTGVFICEHLVILMIWWWMGLTALEQMVFRVTVWSIGMKSIWMQWIECWDSQRSFNMNEVWGIELANPKRYWSSNSQ